MLMFRVLAMEIRTIKPVIVQVPIARRVPLPETQTVSLPVSVGTAAEIMAQSIARKVSDIFPYNIYKTIPRHKLGVNFAFCALQ